MDDVITTGFRKSHMHAFCYNIRDMYYIDKCAHMRFTESSLHVSLYPRDPRSKSLAYVLV